MTLAVLLSLLSALLTVLAALLAWLRSRQRPDDTHVIAALDQVLQRDSAVLRQAPNADPLRFRTAERVKIEGLAWGWGLRPGRVHLVRTVREATQGGYRLRLRAFARGCGGRTIVRSIDVDVHRA